MCSPEEVRPILQVEPGMTAPWLSVVARGQPDEDVAISREQRGVKAWMQADVTGQGVLPARRSNNSRVDGRRELRPHSVSPAGAPKGIPVPGYSGYSGY